VRDWLEHPPPAPAPPPVRQGFMTMTGAKSILLKKGNRLKPLRGDLQMHTSWSDGEGTIVEMAAAAVLRGYQYIALTDHTAGLTIAHGMDESRIEAQKREVESVNAALKENGVPLTVLHAVEMNLSETGAGDVRPAVLKKLDLVLGSFHTGLTSRRDQTARYLSALRNPHVHILGHPQTRRWNKRPGLEADWPRVFAEAAKLGKAVEVDGYVERQDLQPSLLQIAKEEGALISLGSDAHRPAQLDYITFALAAIVQARVPLKRVLNFWDRDALLQWAKAHQ
jgi:histidinol phosphatase-like PHP family hydrolase